jgi:hypothetical protein
MTAPAQPADVRPLACTGRATCRDRTHDTRAEREAWVRDRFAILAAITGSPRVAAALLAHYTRETGWGRSEHNFSLGNIRWTGMGPAFYQQGADDPAPRPYRAYDSAEEGARDAVRLASSGRYAAGWQRLTAGGSEAEWYSRLMQPVDGVAGWHPYSDGALDEFASILASVRALVGLPAAPQPLPLPYYRPGTRPREDAPAVPAQASAFSMPALVGGAVVAAAFYVLARAARR